TTPAISGCAAKSSIWGSVLFKKHRIVEGVGRQV
ncbi:MAG: hypothetical protein ACI9OO_001963, partial [Bacteroidia bacterium]